MTPRCPHCRARIPKPPSRLLRFAALAGAWSVILAMLIGLTLTPLLAVPTVPFVVLAGAALVSSSHHYAFGDRFCPTCERAYELDGEAVQPRAIEPKRASAFAS
ncbi:MAG TPA: hypothetical protein VK034_30415 [Enhygromyxa sp.]|nr:hypothetical protein [Enhygromyxa sp.]